MTLDEFVQTAEALDARATTLISQATTAAELEAVRTRVLGRKSGELGVLMKALPELPVFRFAAQRPADS